MYCQPTPLQLVIDHEYSAAYAYYKVPSPWLQVKLLRLLQYYPPSGKPPRSKVTHLLRIPRGPDDSFRASPSLADNNEQ